MAYYDPENQDENDPNATQAAQTGPQSGVISAQGGSPTTASTTTPAAQNAPDNPGNFVGIQQYLAQNKPQAAKLGETVGNYVTSQGAAASSALDEGQNKFNQDVDQNTVGLNEDLFNQAKATPEQVASDEAKKADFKKMRDAQYSGPKSFEESSYYQPINLQIQNALGTADQTQSQSGRSQLLSSIQKANGERVSSGAANLDTSLLSVSPESKTTLANARNSVTPLKNTLAADSQADAQKATDAAAKTAATQKAIQDAFSGTTGVQGQLESSLTQKAKSAAAQAGYDRDAIIQLLKDGNPSISDQQLKLLGISKAQYEGIINDRNFYSQVGGNSSLQDLTKYATPLEPTAQINAQNIATPEDYARYSALNDLMDTKNTFLNDPTQAGKANLDAINFDYNNVPNALKDRISKAPGMATNNLVYNLNSGSPDTIANLAYGDQSSLVSNMKSTLDSINNAYGTNLSLPQDYIDRAKSVINSNLHSGYNSTMNRQPSASQIDQAAAAAAYVTFLNDLANNPAKLRTPNDQSPNYNQPSYRL